MFLVIIGGSIVYRNAGLNSITLFHIVSIFIMIMNGIFLSFSVSPFLIKRESEGKSGELLPVSWQNKITISFIVSFICWWSNLAVVVLFLVSEF
jgi:uncharacterized membrane protein